MTHVGKTPRQHALSPDHPPGLRIRFSEDLFFFIRHKHRTPWRTPDIRRRASVKDIIESLGVPHTEVGEIRFNGGAVDFNFIPGPPGTLEVTGIDPPFEVFRPSLLRPRPLKRFRFIADLNVMKLGRYMILLGFDVCLARAMADGQIAEQADAQGRIVLTRDTRLLFRKKNRFARRIRENLPMAQLLETLHFFGLSPAPHRFFTRCVRCNRPLAPVGKAKVYHLLEPKTQKYFHDFLRCPGCGQVFWKGSHHDRILARFRAAGIINGA
ncbi:MAG: hypothetical protein HUN04_25135 [Desulfobacter sp.]|nr:MAG: hypothetical protein HUN04_25135 [Desulfobacter sp.]